MTPVHLMGAASSEALNGWRGVLLAALAVGFLTGAADPYQTTYQPLLNRQGIGIDGALLHLLPGAGVAVANGLPYHDALAALTIGPARILGIDRRAGTLTPGSDADLVVWDGDPLEPGTAPASVMLAGHEISLIARQTLLRDRYAPKSK